MSAGVNLKNIREMLTLLIEDLKNKLPFIPPLSSANDKSVHT